MAIVNGNRIMSNNVSMIIIVLLASISALHAQINNSPFYRYQKLDSAKTNNLYLSLSHLSFNKDNEYFNKIADGYTLFGNQLDATLVYYPANNVRLEGGIYLRKDFGNRNYSEIAPVMSVKLQHEHISLIFGTLEGSLNHKLVEPLYDFEKIMLDRQENGLQLLLDKNTFDLDFWINWENMLYRGDSAQEKVSGGISTNTELVNTGDLTIHLPVQITAMHLGGQIDASPLPLTTIVNAAGGLKIESFSNGGFIQGYSLEPYMLFYNDISFQHQDAYKDGYGMYLNFTVKTKLNSIMVSYWNGNEYISTHGGLLYNSRSTSYKNPGYTENNRQLLILRFLTDIKVLDNLYLTTRFEPFYDFNRKKIEFSLGLYINYQDEFLLKRLERN